MSQKKQAHSYWREHYVRWLEQRIAGDLLTEAERVVRKAQGHLTDEERKRHIAMLRRQLIINEIRAAIKTARRAEALGIEEEREE